MLIFKNKKAFTLIELLTVVLILGILTAIALPQYRRSIERTRVAEALTVLRSVYDSCERFAYEKGFSDDEEENSSCFSAVKAKEVTFPKLDVLLKGTYGLDKNNNKTVLTTANFKYELLEDSIRATTTDGRYQGAYVSFDGERFSCVNNDNAECANDANSPKCACVVWGAVTWNQ